METWQDEKERGKSLAILGLTHDDTGTALQRLPIAIKVSIGLAPDLAKGRKHPQRLDHFQFLSKAGSDKDFAWEPDASVTKVMTESYGDNPRNIDIILLDDSLDNVFRTNYAWWTTAECKCKGDLVQIDGIFKMQGFRRTEKHPEGEVWPGKYKYTTGEKKGQPVEECGDGCPDLEEGKCKPSGDLYFILAKYPMLGAICRIHTTSYRSIRNISNALQQIQNLTGGRLNGMRVMLNVGPEKISYEDDKGKHTSTGHILNVRIDASSINTLIENMTETAKLFQNTRKILGNRRIQIVDDEENPARAREIAGEFYPGDEPRALPAPVETQNVEERDLEAKARAICEKAGFTKAKTEGMLGQYQGKLEELIAKVEPLVPQTTTEASAPAASEPTKIAEEKPKAAAAPPAEKEAKKGGKKSDANKNPGFQF